MPVEERFRRRLRKHDVVVKVSSNFEEMMQVVAIRAAVYLTEQNCPYAEEFDGNDFTATHVLALADGEPAGCIRLRYFADFVKYERMTVRRQFRCSNVSDEMIRFSLALIRRKGFRTVYGHAAKNLVRYWQRWGFEPLEETIRFSGHEFVPCVLQLAPVDERLSLDSSPMVLNRPEGDWDRQGVLEASVERELDAAIARHRGVACAA
jgi:predicted GNAT family N-acyltransferase